MVQMSVVKFPPNTCAAGTRCSHYTEVLTNDLNPHIAWTTFTIATTAMAIMLVIAIPLAYFMVFKAGKWELFLLLSLVLADELAPVVKVYAWQVILGRNGILNWLIPGPPVEWLLYSRFAVILTLATTYITYTTIPIYAAMKAIEPSMFEAATDLGAGWWQQTRKILIPLAAPGIFVAMILVYIPMLTDFVTSDIVGGAGSYMMGQRVRDLILEQGDWGAGLRAELPPARDVGACCLAGRLPARPTEQDRRMSADGDITTDAGRKARSWSKACTKRFGDVTAVDDVSLTIPGGEFFSMLGPSGCGKTTTLRMIAGFETPDAGRILLQGGDVTHVPPAKRNVNMVFQAYGLFPHMTVAENIAFGPKIKKLSRAETSERRRRGGAHRAARGHARTAARASSPAASSSGSRWRARS